MSCTALSAGYGEPLVGTAPTAPYWLCIEDPGPWRPAGFIEWAGDPDVARTVARRAEAFGVRIQLIRRPTRPEIRGRRVLLASTSPNRRWLRARVVHADQELVDLDFPAILADADPAWSDHPEPVYLVCTHGRRDACCALLGRRLLDAVSAVAADRVWETTHTGGHRFAPNIVLLPDGLVHGRVGLDEVQDLLAGHAQRQVDLEHLRGRSCYTKWEQAAEVLSRRELGITDIDGLVVATRAASDTSAVLDVTTASANYVCNMELVPTGIQRPVSCGAEDRRDPGVYVMTSLNRTH